MAKDDFTCDVCGEYVPPHAPDCSIVADTRRKDAAAKAKAKLAEAKRRN